MGLVMLALRGPYPYRILALITVLTYLDPPYILNLLIWRALMDLSGLDFSNQAENTAVLHIVHPVTLEEMYTDENEAVTITLLGMDSAVAKRITKARAQKQLNARKQKIDLDEAREFSTGLLSKLIVSSVGLKEGGIDLDLSDNQTAVDVLTRFTWLREQIDEFVTDRANFYKA